MAGQSSQVGCSCTGDECSASTCDHVSMFDTDNAEARTIDGKSARGQFPYDEIGRIILDVSFNSVDFSLLMRQLFDIMFKTILG